MFPVPLAQQGFAQIDLVEGAFFGPPHHFFHRPIPHNMVDMGGFRYLLTYMLLVLLRDTASHLD
jgi:hypothetical protein